MRDKILSLLEIGEKEIKIELGEIEKRSQDSLRNAKRSWGFLCVEARIDLHDIEEYVNWKKPDIWSSIEDCHRFHIAIPGFNLIIAQYKKHEDHCEWYLDCWGVASYEKNTKTWLVYPNKSIAYILAIAKEKTISKVHFEEVDHQVVS